MKKNEIYLEGAGGNKGCTEKLYMTLVDFILVLNDKRYRFSMNEDGNLSILCTDCDEKIDVWHGNKRVSLIKNSDPNYGTFEKERRKYLEHVDEAKNSGCKGAEYKGEKYGCPFRVSHSLVYPDMCGLTGEKLDSDTVIGGHCPFVKQRSMDETNHMVKFMDAMGIDNVMKEEEDLVQL